MSSRDESNGVKIKFKFNGHSTKDTTDGHNASRRTLRIRDQNDVQIKLRIHTYSSEEKVINSRQKIKDILLSLRHLEAELLEPIFEVTI